MRLLTRILCLAAALSLAGHAASAAEKAKDAAAADQPFGIGLEGFAYPYPVQFLDLAYGGEDLRMAYMDIPAGGVAHGRTAKMPDARIEVFEGIGHLVHLEQPQRFNTAVLNFFNEGSQP